MFDFTQLRRVASSLSESGSLAATSSVSTANFGIESPALPSAVPTLSSSAAAACRRSKIVRSGLPVTGVLITPVSFMHEHYIHGTVQSRNETVEGRGSRVEGRGSRVEGRGPGNKEGRL